MFQSQEAMIASSGIRTLKTVFETFSDWSVVKWSVLIGREHLSRE